MATNENIRPPFPIADSIVYAEGSIVSRQLTMSEAGNITLFAFDKGQRLSEHTAPFDAVVQVVEGEAAIRLGGNDFTIRQGEMLVMPAGVPHAVLANTQFKMLLTMIKG